MANTLAVLLLIILSLIEVPARPDLEEIPLSRSLGYSVKRSLSKSLEDSHLSREYMELYHDMLKASKESYEKVDEEEARLETIVGKEKADLMKRGLIDRRRSITRLGSPAGRRRVRSQATRRNKLNSQSLRSHQHHIRHAGVGEVDLETHHLEMPT